MPDKILLTFITPTRLRAPRALAHVLDAFEGLARATPTHWGPDERARNPYDRDDLLREVGAIRGDELVVGLARRKAPRFEAHVSLGADELHYVKGEFGGPLSDSDVRLAFDLGGAIAESTAAEFGIVHPIWKLGERSQRYSASGIVRPMDFARCGPRAICARTWLGPRLAQPSVVDALRKGGCVVRAASSGGVEADLVDQPWTADFETLSARQEAVMSLLAATGAFGDYSDRSQCKPGAQWTPIPIPEAP